MKILQIVFGVIWVLGYLGNSFLFIYTEWSILQNNFLQIFNPSIHFQVLGLLISNPWFWIFLAMAIVGHFAVSQLENHISKIRQAESAKKNLQQQSKSSLYPPSLGELNRNSNVDKPNKVHIDSIKSKEKLLKLAIENRQNVEFIYTDKNGEYSERIFAPSSFITMQQTLCVEGYCYLRRSKRTFAIKRMRELRIVSENTLDHNVKTKVDSNSQSLSSTNREKSTDAESKQRPYINFLIDDLESLTNSEWNNVKKLRDIHYELGFRSRKRSQDLRDLISKRLEDLEYDDTKPTRNTFEQNSFSYIPFNYEEGLLGYYGYKVGMKGLSATERHKILDAVFTLPLLPVNNEAYLSEWGEPNSAERLQKLSRSISMFARIAKGRTNGDFSKAIQDWESDLVYLKKTYYDTNYFSFHYPIT